ASESQALAERLLKHLGQPVESARRFADEAAGHPLFIDALARQGGEAPQAARTLDDVLWQRTRTLDEMAQTILTLVALSNGSLAQEVVARAASIDMGMFARQVAALRVAHFIRSTGARAQDTIAAYHDRVRV